MGALTTRLRRLEDRAPRSSPLSAQDRILALIVNDAAALGMAERLRVLRAAGSRLTTAEMLALPGMREVHERIMEKYAETAA